VRISSNAIHAHVGLSATPAFQKSFGGPKSGYRCLGFLREVRRPRGSFGKLVNFGNSRDLFLLSIFGQISRTPITPSVADSMGLARLDSVNLAQLAPKVALCGGIGRKDGHWAFQGHSKSPIFVLIEKPHATSY